MRNPSGSTGQGVPLTWSAPDRLQACSSSWSSAAGAIAAGRAGHLVDQLLRSLAHQTDTQTRTQTPPLTQTPATWSTSCCSSRDRAPGPWPAAAGRRPRAGQVDQVLADPGQVMHLVPPAPPVSGRIQSTAPPYRSGPHRTHQARRSAAGSPDARRRPWRPL